MTQVSKFQQRLEEKRRREAEAAAQANPEPNFDSDLIPDSGSEYSEQDRDLDLFINSIDILDAYRRWCGKSTIDLNTRKTEGIMISCPTPGHADKNPSAWINTDKQTWFCGGCQVGGDTYDIAAYHFGYPVPGYKDGENFHKLRKEMAESYGYTFITPPGVKGEVMVPPEPEENAPAAPAPSQIGTNADNIESSPEGSEQGSDAEILDLFEIDDEEIVFPNIDWRSFIPKETFIDTYMQLTSIDDVAEEYHFWNALLALGFALGRDVTLEDAIPVYGNLFVCTLGHSGSGKSKARYHLDTLLNEALPHKWDDPTSKGVRKVSAPGSAEVLIHNFSKPISDPANPKITAYYAPVRGLIDFNELSALVGKSSRQGNVTKPVMMQMYDMERIVATSSMTHGAKEAHEPFASALTTTQPRAIRTLLTRGDADSGFLNRWVFAAGPEKQRFAIGGVVIDLSPAVDSLLKVLGWAASFPAGTRIQWSPEAAELYTKFFHSTIEPERKQDESSIMTRVDLLMKKLILLFTANRQRKVVPIESVEDAINMYDYIVQCYSILSNQIGSGLLNEIRNEIARIANSFQEKKNTGISMRDLNLRLKRRNYPIDLVAKVIKYMCDLGELEASVSKGVGRPTTRYRYVG